MIAVAAWLAALCGLVVAAAVATARARTRPDDIVERRWFVALALVHPRRSSATRRGVWTWGGARAVDAREDRLRDGAQVALELRGIDVPLTNRRQRSSIAVPATSPSVPSRPDIAAAGRCTPQP